MSKKKSPKQKVEPPKEQKPRILVLGDWVVDDNRTVAEHESELSSRIGKTHLRALGGLNSRTRSFCGAARVARKLWSDSFEQEDSDGSPRVKRSSVEIVGLGRWSVDDDAMLRRLFLEKYLEGVNPFSLTRQGRLVGVPIEGLELVNLAKVHDEENASEIGTLRVERQYRRDTQSPHGLKLEQRLDFHLPSDDEDSIDAERLRELLSTSQENAVLRLQRSIHGALAQLNEDAHHYTQASQAEIQGTLRDLQGKLKSLIPDSKERPKIFSHVVLKDLGKGTITEHLITAVLESGVVGRETQWFISSKHAKPSWLGPLVEQLSSEKQGKIRVLLLPSKAVRMWWEQGGDDVVKPSRWFLSASHPSYEALRWLEGVKKELGESRNPKDCLVVATPRGMELLAHHGEHAYWQPRQLVESEPRELSGRASAFFASLITCCIQGSLNPKEALENSLHKSSEYIDAQVGRLRRAGLPEDSAPVVGGRDTSSPGNIEVINEKWEDLIANWVDAIGPPAMEGNVTAEANVATEANVAADAKASVEDSLPLIIAPNHPPVLQLWRGARDVSGFVEVIDARRSGISRLTHLLGRYARHARHMQVSTLIQASPGSGKTFLVQRIAEELGLDFLEINVTRRSSRTELLAAFDEISSLQARHRNRRLLIFVDEINARLSGSPVYDMFLGLLDEKIYLRNGTLFRLEPCAWIFAGTELLLTIEERDLLKEAYSQAVKTFKEEQEQAQDIRKRLREHPLEEVLPFDNNRLLAWLGTFDDEQEAAYIESKAPDFTSRLSLPRVLLSQELNGRGQSQARFNRVYVGASRILERYPGTQSIQRCVLLAFAAMENVSNRDLNHAVKDLRDVAFDRVGWKNVKQASRLHTAYLSRYERDEPTDDHCDWVLIEEKPRPRPKAPKSSESSDQSVTDSA